jgi:hypothetical protein
MEVTSIAYDAHLLSLSELISSYCRIERVGTLFIVSKGARQAILFITLNVRGSFRANLY